MKGLHLQCMWIYVGVVRLKKQQPLMRFLNSSWPTPLLLESDPSSDKWHVACWVALRLIYYKTNNIDSDLSAYSLEHLYI